MFDNIPQTISYEIPYYRSFTAAQAVSSVLIAITAIALAYIIATHWPLSSLSFTMNNTLLFGTPSGIAFISFVTLAVFTFLKSRLNASKPIINTTGCVESASEKNNTSNTPPFYHHVVNATNKVVLLDSPAIEDTISSSDNKLLAEEIKPFETTEATSLAKQDDIIPNPIVVEDIPQRVSENITIISKTLENEDDYSHNSSNFNSDESQINNSVLISLNELAQEISNLPLFDLATIEDTNTSADTHSKIKAFTELLVEEIIDSVTQHAEIETNKKIEPSEILDTTFFVKQDISLFNSPIVIDIDIESVAKTLVENIITSVEETIEAKKTLKTDLVEKIVSKEAAETIDPLPNLSSLEWAEYYLNFISPIYKNITDFLVSVHINYNVLNKGLDAPSPNHKDFKKLSAKFKKQCLKLKNDAKISELKIHFSNLWTILSLECVKILKVYEFTKSNDFQTFRSKLLSKIDKKIIDYYLTSDFIKNFNLQTFKKSFVAFSYIHQFIRKDLKEAENNYLEYLIENISTKCEASFINFKNSIADISIDLLNGTQTNIQILETIIDNLTPDLVQHLSENLPKNFDPFIQQVKNTKDSSEKKQELSNILYKCVLNNASENQRQELFNNFFHSSIDSFDFSLRVNSPLINILIENGKLIYQVKKEKHFLNPKGYDYLYYLFNSLFTFFNPDISASSCEVLIDIAKKDAPYMDIANIEKKLSLECDEPILLVGSSKNAHSEALDIYNKKYKKDLESVGYVPLTPVSDRNLDLVTLKFYQNSFKAWAIRKALNIVSMENIILVLNKFFNVNLISVLDSLNFSKPTQSQLFSTLVNILTILIPTVKEVTLSEHLPFGKNFSQMISEHLLAFLKTLKNSENEVKSLQDIQNLFQNVFLEAQKKMDPFNLLA